MGPITADEIRAMRRMLRSDNLLQSLREWERAQREEPTE
jgi:hypothetical protein